VTNSRDSRDTIPIWIYYLSEAEIKLCSVACYTDIIHSYKYNRN